MRRNDLTSDEVRFDRLLKSLDQGPAAPDAEFLRQSREASTRVFLAAIPNRPRPVPTTIEPPLNPAVGRIRLRTLRVSMLTSVVGMLLLGLFSHQLFPSRGVELRVALDNLNRASSGVIEFQNDGISNTMLFVRDDLAVRRLTEFSSGNAELFDGASNYFINREKNSIHPSPPEADDFTATAVEQKLLSNLNVNDPQVQLSVLNQRPQTWSDENGKRLYHYNFTQPSVSESGDKLTVNATVNAEDNTLIAMNTEVFDAAGNPKLRANADVKSLNTAIPEARFQIDPQAAEQPQIAMVEDVQGNAYVDDLAPLPPVVDFQANGQVLDRVSGDNRPNYSGYGMGRNRGFGAELPKAQTAFNLPQGLSGQAAQDRPINNPLADDRPDSFEKKPAVSGIEAAARSVAGGAGAPTQLSEQVELTTEFLEKKKQSQTVPGAVDKADQPRSTPSRAVASGSPLKPSPVNSQPAPAAPAAPRTVPVPSPAPADAATANARVPYPVKAMPKDALAGEPLGGGVEKFSENPRPQKGLGTDRTKETTDNSRSGQKVESTSQKGRYVSPNADTQQQVVSPLKQSQATYGQSKPGSGNRDFDSNAAATEQEEVAPKANWNARGSLNSPVESKLGLQFENGRGDQSGLGNYNPILARRQLTPQSEILSRNVLNTQDDPSSVIRAKLANGADLYVGPSSEVMLLKPTELRLQTGELMLNVPKGDQVDLLGPEPPIQNSPDNYRLSQRRSYPSPLKTGVARRQVTGRAAFRVENRQLQLLDEEPAWLTTYYARIGTRSNSNTANTNPTNPDSVAKQPAAAAQEAPIIEKARATEPASPAP